MRIQDLRHIVLMVVRTARVVVPLLAVCCVSGCVALGFLLSPGPYEKGVVPAYDLCKQQDRKVMIMVECPRSVVTDHDFSEQMLETFQFYLIAKAKFDPENIILQPMSDIKSITADPKEIARSKGAGYVLLVHVDDYAVDFLQIRDYYAGELVTRSMLLDVDLGTAVWPEQPVGKMIHVLVEMETEGRDALVSRMIASTAHCTLRNLYHCDKLTYKNLDERISMQEAFEMETY